VRRFLVAALLALVLVAGLVIHAAAQVEPLKHHACWSPAGPQAVKQWNYLPDGTQPCPTGWQKIDWIDD